MNASRLPPPEKAALNVCRVIWGTSLLSVGTLALACSFLAKQLDLDLQEEALIVQVRTVFFILALLFFPLMNLLRRVMLYSWRGRGTKPDPASSNEKPFQSRRYSVAVVVSMALAEAMGILGMVLCLLGDPSPSPEILMSMSVLAMVLYRPRREELRGGGACQKTSG